MIHFEIDRAKISTKESTKGERFRTLAHAYARHSSYYRRGTDSLLPYPTQKWDVLERTPIATTQQRICLAAGVGSESDLQVDLVGGTVCAEYATASATMMLCQRILLKLLSFDDLTMKIEIRLGMTFFPGNFNR